MNPLFEAALELQQFLQHRGWKFCIIGGLAVVRWGQPRATQDVDVTLMTGLGSEAQYVDPLLESFSGRLPDTRQFALENRVLLVSASNGIPLDITLAAYAYEEQIISRATAFEYVPGVPLTTASAEDLIILKAFAARDQDWVDVEGIVDRQGDELDWDYIIEEFIPLSELQGESKTLNKLKLIQQRDCES
ncbi:MAG: hypothetical protein IID46_04375 [Planctomycetes bacterium]|nr:hypothetical protein [Planctomycetota bacterium]